MILTPEQDAILMRADKTGRIEPEDKLVCKGAHFCPDWDYQAICLESPEWETCTCKHVWPDPEYQP